MERSSLRIAMIGHKRIPGREGGVEVVVEELSLRMKELGHQVTVYNRYARGFHKQKEYRGVRIITVPTINHKNLDAIIYTFLATLHAVLCDYDVIHYHAEGPCSMLWLARLFGKRTVATIHGLDWQRAKWGSIATKFLVLGEKVAAAHANEIIVLSKNVQTYFLEKYSRQTNYIPNGVNSPVIRQANCIREKYGLSQCSYILYLARLVPEKGAHHLLSAYRRLGAEQKLVIAGAGGHASGYEDELRRAASEDHRVIMPGFVSGEELEELYSNCSLYVLPSDIEGMPLTLLEAMSYGVPCLVSDIPENREVGGSLCNYFAPGDRNDLQEKLKEALARSDERVHYPIERFSWDSIVEATLMQYHKRGNYVQQHLEY